MRASSSVTRFRRLNDENAAAADVCSFDDVTAVVFCIVDNRRDIVNDDEVFEETNFGATKIKEEKKNSF